MYLGKAMAKAKLSIEGEIQGWITLQSYCWSATDYKEWENLIQHTLNSEPLIEQGTHFQF